MEQSFFSRLSKSDTVLLAGAGGGYDIYCGLPLYHWLRARGKTVHLANLAFTNLRRCQGEFPLHSLLRVNLQTSGPAEYFPELHLSAYLGGEPIYAIENAGAAAVKRAYDWLVGELKPDTLILVDGGTDILMRGDEQGLGTPEEDCSSLLAGWDVPVAEKLVACLGFGIDSFHGVCHAHFLENVADLIKVGGFLGSWTLTQDMEEYDFYREACAYCFRAMPDRLSIVNGSIVSATEGEFGDVHSSSRTRGSELFINPLMSLYWGFDLVKLAERNLYLPSLRDKFSRNETALTIERFHDSLPRHRRPRLIPH
ncbi:DUF1152 domain-containing protein [bacterium]|nr:DUF1152 domain-containing protein [bacterium]